MRKRIFAIIIVILAIIDLIAATLIFSDIQLMQTPETTINIDIVKLDSEEAIISAVINISNQNSFEVITKNFEIVTVTPNKEEVAHILMKGGYIPPNGGKTFTASAIITFDGQVPESLTSKITGTLGMNIGFIQKTIPLAICIVTSMGNVMKELASPDLYIGVDFGEITQEGINVTGVVDVYNPNTFDIYIKNVSAEIKTETGKNVGNLSIIGGTIPSKNSLEISSTGRILIDALNAKALFFKINATVGVKIAGINRSMPLSFTAKVKIPDLRSLFSLDSPTDLIVRCDYKASINGLIEETTLEINNPNKITLTIKDIVISSYIFSDNEKKLISEFKLKGGTVQAENTTYLKGETIIPYYRLLPSGRGSLLPDGVELTVRGNVSVQGINQSILLRVGSYQDLHIFS